MIPWRRAWQPIPEFLPGESHGQRSLEGFHPKDHKESDRTEATEHVHKPFALESWRVGVTDISSMKF